MLRNLLQNRRLWFILIVLLVLPATRTAVESKYLERSVRRVGADVASVTLFPSIRIG